MMQTKGIPAGQKKGSDCVKSQTAIGAQPALSTDRMRVVHIRRANYIRIYTTCVILSVDNAGCMPMAAVACGRFGGSGMPIGQICRSAGRLAGRKSP